MFKRFLNSSSGNVGIMFGLSAIPLMIGAGTAIDYQQASNVRTSLQSAVDSAALYAANLTGSNAAIIARSKAFFNSNFSAKSGSQLTSSDLSIVDLPRGRGKRFVFTAKADVPTTLMQIVGFKTIAVSALAASQRSSGNVEVALVLDNTGSMALSGRMVSLKHEALVLVDKLAASHTKIAIVPFDTQVKVDNATGLSAAVVTAPNPLNPAIPCSSIADPQDRTACETATRALPGLPTDYLSTSTRTWTSGQNSKLKTYTETTYVYSDSSAVRITLTQQQSKTDIYTTEFQAAGSASWTPAQLPVDSKDNDTITANNDLLAEAGQPWSGCVIDRQQPHDVSVLSPTAGNAATSYPKANCAVATLQSIMPLQDNPSAARAKIASMMPSGNTNVSIGVQWGVEALSPTAPLTGGSAFGASGIEKHMIVVTDGLNTQNRWTTDAVSINARTLLACNAVKAQNVIIHTIRLQEGDAALLRACASTPENFYDVSNPVGLSAAFDAILDKISKVTLTE